MECGYCGKQLLSKPDKPIEGGIKINYQIGIYYPVCDSCADTNRLNKSFNILEALDENI